MRSCAPKRSHALPGALRRTRSAPRRWESTGGGTAPRRSQALTGAPRRQKRSQALERACERGGRSCAPVSAWERLGAAPPPVLTQRLGALLERLGALGCAWERLGAQLLLPCSPSAWERF
eukprot:3664763-Pyramimonas_sp.AAC.1